MSENLKVLKPVEINRTKKGALKIQCSQNGGGHLRSQTRYAVAFFKAIKHRMTRFLAKNALGTFSPTLRGFSSCLHKKTTTNVVVFWRRTPSLVNSLRCRIFQGNQASHDSLSCEKCAWDFLTHSPWVLVLSP